MIDSHLKQQVADLQGAIDRLAPELSRIQKSVDLSLQFGKQVESVIAQFNSPFEKMVLLDRAWTYSWKLLDDHNALVAAMERHRKDHLLITVALPKRGWYLSGEEPCTLSNRLANAIRGENWDSVDQQMMEHLPEFRTEALRQWLSQEGVPEYCINRLFRFLKHHQEGNYEEATYLGVPLLDEIAMYLYGGKAFTTKRASRRGSEQSKPELAFKTASGPDLASYCQDFVQAFGSLQEDSDQKSLADENYWNRHAIVHGLMQRPMGVKDSAKCLMALQFLFCARQEKDEIASAEQQDSA